jgi:hypothetical protein
LSTGLACGADIIVAAPVGVWEGACALACIVEKSRRAIEIPIDEVATDKDATKKEERGALVIDVRKCIREKRLGKVC